MSIVEILFFLSPILIFPLWYWYSRSRIELSRTPEEREAELDRIEQALAKGSNTPNWTNDDS